MQRGGAGVLLTCVPSRGSCPRASGGRAEQSRLWSVAPTWLEAPLGTPASAGPASNSAQAADHGFTALRKLGRLSGRAVHGCSARQTQGGRREGQAGLRKSARTKRCRETKRGEAATNLCWSPNLGAAPPFNEHLLWAGHQAEGSPAHVVLGKPRWVRVTASKWTQVCEPGLSEST